MQIQKIGIYANNYSTNKAQQPGASNPNFGILTLGGAEDFERAVIGFFANAGEKGSLLRSVTDKNAQLGILKKIAVRHEAQIKPLLAFFENARQNLIEVFTGFFKKDSEKFKGITPEKLVETGDVVITPKIYKDGGKGGAISVKLFDNDQSCPSSGYNISPEPDPVVALREAFIGALKQYAIQRSNTVKILYSSEKPPAHWID